MSECKQWAAAPDFHCHAFSQTHASRMVRYSKSAGTWKHLRTHHAANKEKEAKKLAKRAAKGQLANNADFKFDCRCVLCNGLRSFILNKSAKVRPEYSFFHLYDPTLHHIYHISLIGSYYFY